MPNILHIDTERSWRGGQRQATYLFEALHKKGFATKMICRPSSSLALFCQERGLPYCTIPMKNEFCLLSAWEIAKICKRENFSIAHLHSAHAIAVGFWLKLFCPKIKLIGVRRVDFHLKKNFFSRLKYARLDRLVCISQGIEKVVKADGYQNTTVIHSGVDLERFKADTPKDIHQEFGFPQGDIIVGTVAALVGHKDYPNLLQTAKIVCQKVKNVSFVAVGEGRLQAELEKMHHELGLGNRFVFAGFRESVGSYLKSFDIFVLASHLEGLGTSILDAQALGLPVVASASGGIPEAVFDEENGLLVPKKSPEKLAEALVKLIKDEQMRKQMGNRGKKTVQRFDIKKTIEKNIELYQELSGGLI